MTLERLIDVNEQSRRLSIACQDTRNETSIPRILDRRIIARLHCSGIKSVLNGKHRLFPLRLPAGIVSDRRDAPAAQPFPLTQRRRCQTGTPRTGQGPLSVVPR